MKKCRQRYAGGRRRRRCGIRCARRIFCVSFNSRRGAGVRRGAAEVAGTRRINGLFLSLSSRAIESHLNNAGAGRISLRAIHHSHAAYINTYGLSGRAFHKHEAQNMKI